MKSLKTNVSLSLDWDLLEKVRVLAEEDDRALSSYINIVLKAHVEEIEKGKGE